MKKIYQFILIFILSSRLFSQIPQGFNYQAVVCDVNGQLLVGKDIGIRISLLQNSNNGNSIYVENHTSISNENGLINVIIGSGEIKFGEFSKIDWAKGPYFVKSEIDPLGGSNYSVTTISQLLSVPFALLSANSKPGPQGEVGDKGEVGVRGSSGDKPVYAPKISVVGDTLSFKGGSYVIITGISPAGSIGSINCESAVNSGFLTLDSVAVDVSSIVEYTGGNGGVFKAIQVQSKGVLGLEARILADTFAIGSGSLKVYISGVPSSNGLANFDININGVLCRLTRVVDLPVGVVSSLNCDTIVNTGNLAYSSSASNVKSEIKYLGGNGFLYAEQNVLSEGVLGLTANLLGGKFNIGVGSVIYSISGVPLSDGIATFNINLGGKSCVLQRIVYKSGFGPNISDIEGNTYKTVYIGSQQWMAENLKVSKYNDGTNINVVKKFNGQPYPSWAVYNNDSLNNLKYGSLYNWYAISPSTNNNKNVCPVGWHVPTIPETYILMNYLTDNSSNWSLAGVMMKEKGTKNWLSPNTGATNSSLFTALPGGYGSNTGSFLFLGYSTYFWTLTEVGLYPAKYFYLNTNDTFCSFSSDFKSNGMSVRCLKD